MVMSNIGAAQSVSNFKWWSLILKLSYKSLRTQWDLKIYKLLTIQKPFAKKTIGAPLSIAMQFSESLLSNAGGLFIMYATTSLSQIH